MKINNEAGQLYIEALDLDMRHLIGRDDLDQSLSSDPGQWLREYRSVCTNVVSVNRIRGVCLDYDKSPRGSG